LAVSVKQQISIFIADGRHSLPGSNFTIGQWLWVVLVKIQSSILAEIPDGALFLGAEWLKKK
jgi:hypothetical protein